MLRSSTVGNWESKDFIRTAVRTGPERVLLWHGGVRGGGEGVPRDLKMSLEGFVERQAEQVHGVFMPYGLREFARSGLREGNEGRGRRVFRPCSARLEHVCSRGEGRGFSAVVGLA